MLPRSQGIPQPISNALVPSPPFGDTDFATFQKKVQLTTGIALSHYKADQMRRRISTLAEKAGCTSFDAYSQLMERDVDTLASFMDRMTINVTELMRNPNLFDDLANVVLPTLIASRKGAPLSVWSAGCSYGAEAYTVSMLLHELDPAQQHRVKGTDIDLAVLARAEHPVFTAIDMANVSPARRMAHFHYCGGGYKPNVHLERKVRFGRHDLLTDPYPAAGYDLILCRNVVIYFTDEAKEMIYRKMFSALRPGGVLFVGGTERIASSRDIGFTIVKSFFYRRPD